MNYMIGVILMAINFPKFEIPKLELGSLIPNIPKLPDINNMKFKNITSAIDNLQKNNLYSQIDEPDPLLQRRGALPPGAAR